MEKSFTKIRRSWVINPVTRIKKDKGYKRKTEKQKWRKYAETE